MLGDASVGLSAAPHHLLRPALRLTVLLSDLQAAMYHLGPTIVVLVVTLQRHEFAAVAHTEQVHAAAVAAAEAEEMDGVEHIRLALAVAADEAVQLRRKAQLRLRYILII